MRAAIPLVSCNGDNTISPRFARSHYFAITDTNTRTLDIIENPYVNLKMHTGKNIIDMLIRNEKIDTLIVFELGLNVQQFAKKAKIRLILIHEMKGSLDNLLKLMRIKERTP